MKIGMRSMFSGVPYLGKIRGSEHPQRGFFVWEDPGGKYPCSALTRGLHLSERGFPLTERGLHLSERGFPLTERAFIFF